jgi:hypothetical protein
MEYHEYPFSPSGLPVSGHRASPGIFGSRPPISRSLAAGNDDADRGGNGEPPDQGVEAIDDVGEAPSGVRVAFTDDEFTNAPDDGGDPGHPPSYTQIDPVQSGVGGQVPWHEQGPSQTPAPRTTSTSQVWTAEDPVEIGVQTPFSGREHPDDTNDDEGQRR